MPFEKEPTYPLEEEGEKKEEEIEKEEVEIEKTPEESKEEMAEEKPEAKSEKEIPEAEEEISEIQRKIEEMKEKELEERKAEEMIEEKERKLETMKELVRESLPEKFEDLVGDNSEEAWDKRKELAEKEPMYTAANLAGVASEKSRDWLDKNKESQKMWWGISRGLIGDDTEKAWEIRDFLEVDKRVDRIRGKRWSILKKTLDLYKSEFLFNLRGRIKFPGWYEPGDIVISTTGLDSEKSWKLREELEDIAPAEVLISLAGNDSEKAQQIREKYKGDKKLEWAYQKSLIGREKSKE
jgi:TolA-binding protein